MVDVPTMVDVPKVVDVPAPEDVPAAPTMGVPLIDNMPVFDIALGGGFVYYTEGNNVRRVPIAGGASELMYTTGSNSLATQFVDADDARFVWTQRNANSTVQGAVRACAHTGCGAMPMGVPAAQGGESTNRIAVQGDLVYWTSGTVSRVVGTHWASPLPMGNLARSGVSDVAIDGDEVFWTNAGLSIAMRPGSVLKCPARGNCNTPTELATMVGSPHRIAVRGAVVLVLSPAGLYRMDRAGGGLVRLADGASANGDRSDLATDGVEAFWSENDRLFTCTLSACVPRVMASVPGQGSRGIELDDTTVYWGLTASIRRIAR